MSRTSFRRLFVSVIAGLMFGAGGAVGSAAAAPDAPTTEIHVSPAGNDKNDGSESAPFASPARAAEVVRDVRKAVGAATVVLHGGTYRLSEPLRITPAESGAANAPVLWTARPGETVILSGGTPLAGWREAEFNGRKVWIARGPGHEFRSFWVAGDEPRTRARHPDGHDHLTVPESPEPDARWEDGQLQFNYKPGEVPSFTPDDAEVLHFTRWVESRLPVLRDDTKLRELRFLRRTVFQVQAGDLFRIENAPEFLDQPGEWYYRKKTDEVFYLPKPGETLDGFEVVVPRLSQLVRLEGKPEAGRFVQHVTFRGITFAHTEWTLPGEGTDPNVDGRPNRGGFVQAAYGVPGAIWAEGARNCAIERCTLTHLGSYAVELGRGCQDNRLSHCTLIDLGAGGVKIGDREARADEAEHARGNVVADCIIADYGRLFMSGCGVYIGKSSGNTITHNEIRDGFYTAISVGWNWGYDPTITRDNVIEHNHVHHIGELSSGEGPLLSDMGGLYTLGIQPGTVIRNNRFHHIEGRVYGGWGIYFDEGSSQILAERNLIYTTTHGGFHQHYGRDNVVRNNILAFGRTRQVERSRSEEHRSFTFERNIVVWDQGVGIAGNWDNFNATFRLNQYWPHGKAEPLYGYQSWEQWRARGMDEGSVVADPGFVDAKQGDFRFKPGAGPAESIGFELWDLNDVGPRPAN